MHLNIYHPIHHTQNTKYTIRLSLVKYECFIRNSTYLCELKCYAEYGVMECGIMVCGVIECGIMVWWVVV